ncbi:restriction endonuclease subunit S [Neisseria yangbaofengii]|uniref:restriction endonuclease subunit S n=3 Tax=Neisseria yangbaofengii TaxID=2709396 RepID=UPI001D032D26|nr:restriction endonuclease subunit S [Neisseria yangbaofengii]
MSKHNTPKLRFAQFSGDWEQKTLGDIAKVERGKFSARPRNDPKYFGGDIPFVQTGDVSNSSLFLDNYTQTLNELGLSVSKLFDENTLLITIAANIGDTAITRFKMACPDSLVAISPIKDMSDVFFLKYSLDLQKDNLNSKATQNAQKNINLQVLNPLPIMLPTPAEQTAIGNFFRKIDRLIALNEQKLEHTQTLKKGLLQKMFPQNGQNIPEIRFPQFTNAWELEELGNVVEINPKSTLPDEFEYVDLESVIGTEMIAHRTEYKNSAPSRAQRLAQKGDIFYQTVRPYQKNNYLFELNSGDKIFVFSTGYAQLRPSVSSYFLFSCVQEENFVRKVLDKCTGTSYPAINANDLSKIRVYIPTNPAEQTTIGDFFRRLDGLITLHQRKLEHLKQLKKSLLQQMFV